MADEAPLIFEKRLGGLFRYDAETGELFWRRRPESMFPDPASAARWNGRYAGKRALTAKTKAGYLTGLLFRKHVKAHSVAWAIAHGRWPYEIDHINGDKSDNRIANLREVTRQENSRNRGMRSDNCTGVAGVSKRRGRWLARIQGDSREVTLGTFDTLTEAAAARKAAERRFGYHENHGRQA